MTFIFKNLYKCIKYIFGENMWPDPSPNEKTFRIRQYDVRVGTVDR